jgi:hypothetical protein
LSRQGCDQSSHVLDEVRERAGARARSCHDDQLDVGRDLRSNLAIRFANAPPHAVAPSGATNEPAHREAGPAADGPLPERDEAPPLVPFAVLENRLELRRSPEALASRQR